MLKATSTIALIKFIFSAQNRLAKVPVVLFETGKSEGVLILNTLPETALRKEKSLSPVGVGKPLKFACIERVRTEG